MSVTSSPPTTAEHENTALAAVILDQREPLLVDPRPTYDREHLKRLLG